MRERVLIIGGSGLVGQQLSFLLQKNGYDVSLLGRSKGKNTHYKSYIYDYQNDFIEIEALKAVDFIINLAGSNIGDKRWTKKQKEIIYNSRVQQTDFIFNKIKQHKIKPKAYISASAVGIYGLETTDKTYTEDDKAGNDFLAKVCKDWEEKALQFDEENIRTVILRIGVVLSKNGGVVQKMFLPAMLGLLSPIGNGKQFVPWIHIEDLCRMFLYAIKSSNIKGAYNAVAPESINNKDFTRSLLKSFNKRLILPSVPSFVLHLLFGKRASLLLKGCRITSERIQKTSFEFMFKNLESSLENIFK